MPSDGTPIDTDQGGSSSYGDPGGTSGSGSGDSFTGGSGGSSVDTGPTFQTTGVPGTTGHTSAMPSGDGSSGGTTTAIPAGTSGSDPASCPADPNEPNDTPDTANDLGSITDSDSDGSTITGVLAGPDDSDWFTYHGSDTTFALVNPTRNVMSDGNVTLCKYALCDVSPETQQLLCPDGTELAAATNGAPGCCATNMGFTFDLTCDSFWGDDSATVWIEVLTDDDACVSYSVDYHF